jgi:hypothetical protein
MLHDAVGGCDGHDGSSDNDAHPPETPPCEALLSPAVMARGELPVIRLEPSIVIPKALLIRMIDSASLGS